MILHCPNCAQPALPDAQGRLKPWCSSCGAGLADARVAQPTQPPAPQNATPPAHPLLPAPTPGRLPTYPTPRKPDSPWVILGIGLVFLGLGVVSVASTIGDTLNGLASPNWPKTKGTVVKSWVEEWSTRGGHSYALAAVYRYEVAGKRYESNKVQFTNQLEAGTKSGWEQQLAKLAPAGGTCEVYYNPNEPSRSCLVPGTSIFYLTVLPAIFSLFLLVGVGCTWGATAQILSGKPTRRLQPTPAR